jgi:uncharacterized membrane protein YkoI
MPALRWMLAPVVFLALGASAASADCLSMREARALVQAGEIMPMTGVLRGARDVGKGEMIDGRLCRGKNGLQYVVTFLGPDGRVRRVMLDARTGDVVGVK